MHAGDLPARLLYSPKICAWWEDSDGTFKPGRRANTRGQPLPALAGGLADTPQHARILGLIEPAAIKKDGTAAERQRRYRQRRKA
jgi:hypothetical protein